MSLSDLIKKQASSVFMRAGGFAEDVLYTFGATSVQRTYRAQVIRKGPASADKSSAAARPNAEVFLVNDPAGVVGPPAIDPRDTITIVMSFGQPAKAFPVHPATGQDIGMWQITIG